MNIIAIAAIGKNRELGLGNDLLWRIPDDLKRFRALTLGHPLILGRKTFDSIVAARGGPLPGRRSIVITRDPASIGEYAAHPDVDVALSIDDALLNAGELPGGEEVIIGGGAAIYKAALPKTHMLRLTLIDAEKPADSFFPEYEQEFTHMLSDERREWEGLSYRWVDLTRPSDR